MFRSTFDEDLILIFGATPRPRQKKVEGQAAERGRRRAFVIGSAKRLRRRETKQGCSLSGHCVQVPKHVGSAALALVRPQGGS